MSVEQVSKDAQFPRLMSYVVGNQAAWFTAIGLKSGLFRAIADAGDTGTTDDALVEQLGDHPRYVRVWCLGAYAFELLAWDAAGAVVVSEIPYPDEPTTYRSNPVYRAMAGVQLHEALIGCGMITQGGLGELLEDAGFDNVRVATQPMPTRHVMIGDNPDRQE